MGNNRTAKSAISTRNKWEQETHYSNLRDTASTFNIPETLVPFLKSKCEVNGSLTGYLKYLLNKYRLVCYAGTMAKNEKVKTKYQNKGLKLKSQSFRPMNGDWLELKIIAGMHNCSATFMFVSLLELDQEIGEKMDGMMEDVDPTKLTARPIIFIQTLRKNNSKIRNYCRFGKNFYEFQNTFPR